MTQTPLSRSKGQRSRSPGRFAHHRVGTSGGCSGGHENVLAVGNCCYVAVLLGGARCFGTHGGEGRGHTMAAAHQSLLYQMILFQYSTLTLISYETIQDYGLPSVVYFPTLLPQQQALSMSFPHQCISSCFFVWSFARLIAPVVTTTSTILCFNKHWLTQFHLEKGRYNGERGREI